MSLLALALPVLPVAAAALLAACRRRPSLLGPTAVGGVVATLLLAAWAATAQPSISWRWSPVIELGLAVSGFGRVMVVLVPLVAAPIVAYAAATEPEGRVRLLVPMVAFVGAMEWLVTAGDFVTLLIGWEVVGAISWLLIGHAWREQGASRAAAQAFVTTRAGDLGLYLAAGMTFAATGSFAFGGLGGAPRPALDLVAGGVLLAAAAKSAQLPFSPWLFSAMAGPTPVSALLHSATLVAAGAYLLVILAPALAPVGWFLPVVTAVGLSTALAGGVVATLQPHAKRALAGSTSAQYGLMFVAVGAGSTAAAGAHLVVHAAFKSLMFLAAGTAMHASGTSDLARMRLGRALPRVAVLSGVGALALAAVPPLGGAWTKERILAAAADTSFWLAAALLAAGFLSTLYALRWQILAFGGTPTGVARDQAAARSSVAYRPGAGEMAGLLVLALFTLVLSVLWLPGSATMVQGLTWGALVEPAPWELPASLAVLVLAGITVWLARARSGLVELGLPPSVVVPVADWLLLPAAAQRLVVRPTLALATVLARADARVVDAGVRATAAIALAFSVFFSRRGEWTIDGVVRGTAVATLRAAEGSRVADEQGIDGTAVEGSARLTARAGHASRRLQTGMAHHYYVIAAIGLAVMFAVLALFRSPV